MGDTCGTHKHEECCGGTTKQETKDQQHGSCGCESNKKDETSSCCG